MRINNKVQLLGRIGNIQTKSVEQGKEVVILSIATDDSYKNKQGERVSVTDWHNCVAYRHNAVNISKYLKKGDGVLISGKLKTHKYTDKQGAERYATNVQIESFEFLPQNKREQEQTQSAPTQGQSQEFTQDDLPF